MSATIVICDQDMGQAERDERELVLPADRLTVRELIRERVYQEVKDRNARRVIEGRMLVAPAVESTAGTETHHTIDWKRQFEIACEAFEENRFLILVGERQVEHLNEEIDVSTRTVVLFLRLQLLVGG